MRDNKLHTPVGVRDLLWEETAVKTTVINGISKVFASYGYEQVESPAFEYIEVFSDEKLGSTKPKQMYKFFDRDGSTLALRSDMTPPIARIAATNFAQYPYPLRFSYFGNAFKYNENYQGKLREFAQAGVELMGVESVDADGEMISLAVNSLLSAGIEDFKITIGDVEFFKGMMEETGLSEEICQTLQKHIASRDYVAAEGIVNNHAMPEHIRQIFRELPKLVGTLDVLEYAKGLSKNPRAIQAISRLQELFQVLKGYHVEQYISYDLGMVNQMNYYTGIIFRGYTYDSGLSILDGGRYDNLVAQYGATMPAVGFGLKMSEIVTLLMKKGTKVPSARAKTLVAYQESGRTKACETANIYRHSGMNVEMGLIGEDLEKNIAYAKSKEMSHVLYFLNDYRLKVVSLTDELGGFTVEIPIEELILPESEDAK